MSTPIKLRYLPTNDELLESALSESERARLRAWRKRPVELVYYEAARLLLRWGYDTRTCDINLMHLAYGEAKRRLPPDPLIS